MSQCLWCLENVEDSFSFSNLLYRNVTHNKMCDHCYSQLKPVSKGIGKCGRCEKISEDNLCPDCMNWEKIYPDYDFKHRSLFYYNEFAKAYLKKYKVMGDCELSSLFAHELRAHLRPISKQACIIPIPISQDSKQMRGFNQIELLLDSAEIPYITALKNIGQGEKQSKKNKVDRMKTPQPFVLETEMEPLVTGASILLVDDLYTTGRTLFHAADALKQYSPRRIETFSLFR
ncbi:MAG: phosphoribosyltransferase family protein [Alkalibacterium sp.]|uniref:ComF family protein n=1 Tax=Alkalibacterium sp. TaxID=1872447 RepID=UPI0039707CD4